MYFDERKKGKKKRDRKYIYPNEKRAGKAGGGESRQEKKEDSSGGGGRRGSGNRSLDVCWTEKGRPAGEPRLARTQDHVQEANGRAHDRSEMTEEKRDAMRGPKTKKKKTSLTATENRVRRRW